VRRVELELAPGVRVEFTDRERALGQLEEWAGRGTRFPVVIFGPEGCGKTAFLRQAAAMLREIGTTCFTCTLPTGFSRPTSRFLTSRAPFLSL